MVGGKPAAFEKVKPLFEKMGKSVTLIGGSGAGQVAKACNQILTGMGVAAVAEAFNFASQERRRRGQGARGAAGRLRLQKILENHGQRMLDRNFKPGFKAWMHQKDLRIVMEEAHRMGLMLPSAAATAQVFNAIVGSGMGENDSITALQLLEKDEHAGEQRVNETGFIGFGTMGRPWPNTSSRPGTNCASGAPCRQRRLGAAVALGARVAARWSWRWAARSSAPTSPAAPTSSGLADALSAGPCAGRDPWSTFPPSRRARRGDRRGAPPKGVEFVDAPVSGGGVGARNATLAIMWGGKREELAPRGADFCGAGQERSCASARPAPARWPRPATR
jgi:3-hydroxyisobutyrate dehydrogenase-like beta-hydroxyacid dehydrogenase